eukprot:scaffold6095_cov92-Isochrysis_galbana.AAC.5
MRRDGDLIPLVEWRAATRPSPVSRQEVPQRHSAPPRGDLRAAGGAALPVPRPSASARRTPDVSAQPTLTSLALPGWSEHAPTPPTLCRLPLLPPTPPALGPRIGACPLSNAWSGSAAVSTPATPPAANTTGVDTSPIATVASAAAPAGVRATMARLFTAEANTPSRAPSPRRLARRSPPCRPFPPRHACSPPPPPPARARPRRPPAARQDFSSAAVAALPFSASAELSPAPQAKHGAVETKSGTGETKSGTGEANSGSEEADSGAPPSPLCPCSFAFSSGRPSASTCGWEGRAAIVASAALSGAGDISKPAAISGLARLRPISEAGSISGLSRPRPISGPGSISGSADSRT